ncbi:MAG: spermidine synthase [Cohnella sp.]|nr:spermidine synthase [Cohnella sp.]
MDYKEMPISILGSGGGVAQAMVDENEDLEGFTLLERYEDGIVVFQSGSPYYYSSTLRNTVRSLKKLFPIVQPYLCSIPSFLGGIWSFTMASKKWDPHQADLNRLRWQGAKYINPETFRASFGLPNYIKNIFKET